MKNTEPDQNLPSPGQQLLKAREQKDISAEMVAQRLRLEVKLIHALEKDDYDPFPAAAYVRGHIRGYANMVDLDPDQLVDSFDQNAKKAPRLEPFVSEPKQQAGSGDRHIRVVTYSLIAALTLLIGLWWQTQRSAPETTVDHNDEIVIKEEKQEKESNQLEVLEGSTGNLSLPELTEEKSPIQEEPKALEHTFGVAHFNDLPEPPEQNLEQESLDSPTGSEWNANNQNLSTTLPAVEANLMEEQGIVIQFMDESWVQITDATDAKRYSRLGKTGEVVNVTGVAPFRVVIGRASVVLMSYQGSFIDLDPLAKDEVARFIIDEKGAHR